MATIKILKVRLTLESGMVLEKEWGPKEILPDTLRGRIAIPIWARKAKRFEYLGVTTLIANVEPGFETAASEWIGLGRG